MSLEAGRELKALMSSTPDSPAPTPASVMAMSGAFSLVQAMASKRPKEINTTTA